ncbi:MAG TPA: TonB-dependent receptor [Gemmatimonadetes bacterium]|nr:TonB-dependent receptor [Gemmatimonadota bacterium]
MMSPLILTATLLSLQVPADSLTSGGAVSGGGLLDDSVRVGAIVGVVRTHEGDRVRPLPYAIVQATMPGRQRTLLADSLGRYSIEPVPGGTVRLRISHIAHRSVLVNVVVPDGETVSLDVDLESRPIPLGRITVIADRMTQPRALSPSDTPIPTVELRALGVSPGLGEAGLGEAAAALPGNEPTDPTDVLFMRGSTTDLKLVLLDGAPVYTPFHLGGLLSSFEASALGAVALHTGGAPARYDGGLSYILDLRTRPPRSDRLHVRGRLDLISGSIAAEGPIGAGVGFTASSRTLHNYGTSILGGGHTPYRYRDALGRIDARLSDRHALSATTFWNRESVLLNLNRTGKNAVADPEANFVVPEDATWGNHAVVLAYHGRVSDLSLDATASASGYQAELPLRPPAEDSTFSAYNDGFLAGATTGRLRLALDASAPLGESLVRFGAVVDRTATLYSAHRFSDVGANAGVTQEASGIASGVYADGIRSLAPGLDLRLGLRANAFSTERGVRFAPRIALLWTLTDAALLTVAAGRYHQFSRASDQQVDFTASSSAFAAPGGTLLSVATADHVAVSVDQELTGRVRLGIEGFWKGFAGLGASGGEALNSSGVDLQVLHEGDPFTAWFGYNLSWFWSGGSGLGSTSNFAGRQLLSAGLRGSPKGRTGGALSVSYSAGLPYTSIPFGSRGVSDATSNQVADLPGELTQEDPVFSGRPDDGFLRLDVELFTRFDARIGGQDFEIRPYLRVINALDQRDALFYYFEPWRDAELTPLAERSLLPVFGMEWRF